jgi:streptomycin 6-kinase
MQVPPVLFNSAAEIIGAPRARAWADALDFMLFELIDRWQVTPDPLPSSPWAGAESLVIPVLTKESYQAVIRFAWPNTDNPHVHAQVLSALKAWGGHGAVRVIRDDSSFRATLQERLRTDVNLSSEPLETVAPIWGQLARSLTVPGAPGFVRVQDIAAGWLEKYAADVTLVADFPQFLTQDRAVLDTARAWIERLARSEENWLLHADLHYYNILAGNPDLNGVATWKAIDPQPLTGPTAYMVAPVLWNRLFELPGITPEDQAQWLRDFATDLCNHADIDAAYGIGAAVAREVENMFWYLRSAYSGTAKAFGDAARSLWVCRALCGLSVQGVSAHSLKRLG